jgi:hypothetical protein
MTITVEALYEQAKILTPVERRRLAELLVQPVTKHTSLAERLRAARAQIVASGEPLLNGTDQSLSAYGSEKSLEQMADERVPTLSGHSHILAHAGSQGNPCHHC